MAIDIKFDLAGNPEPPTILLANRNGNILGQLDVDVDSIDLSDKLNDASEFTFTMYKNELVLSENETVLYNEFLKSSNNYVLKDSDGLYLISKDSNGGFIVSKEVFNAYLWDKVVDFKLVYCKEWDAWFEINVELDEATETIKTVFCTQLGQAELSQIMLYNVEINTEADIDRDDYKISILYDADDPEASILNRLLKDKAPHYSIAYVSSTITKIQRSFSFDGTSILDALQEIAEEIGCLFQFYAGIDENGVLQRKIAVYDLQQNCDDCGYRGEFTDRCPKCDGTNITNGHGEDTLIFVTSDELASEGIQLVTDVDSVKNCFKLEAGDDLMTATVRSCNPNGTDYIWYFSDALKEDMSDELVDKLETYDELYRSQYNDSVSNIDGELLANYNLLVDKYLVYNEDLQKIETPVIGYPALMNAYYNTIDLALYLKSGLMPSVEMSETNAEEQAGLLIASSLSPVAVADINIVSLATANTAVLAMAKTVVKSTYKVEIKSSELYEENGSKYWRGNFIVTNYSDEEDAAESNLVSVELNDDLETVTRQKIEKMLNKDNTDDMSVTGLFKKEYDDFCAELKKYALNPLTGFYDACQSCIDILIDQGVGNDEGWSDEEGSDGNLYEKLYLPYYNKLKAIEAEMKVREDEINIVLGVYDDNGDLVVEGLQPNIEDCRNQIQSTLNFEDYLGEKLWLEFCAYRREDKYTNGNYISDGLDNAELFKRAQEFFKTAENEIYKSAELQHSISTTLNNLLAIPKFKPLIKSFNIGNWIRVQIDDKIYKLRLLEYDISFGDFNTISVEFSDVSKIKNGTTDVREVLSQASSIATSYGSVQRQASQGDRAKSTIEQWIADGLNSANVQIQNNDSEDITLTKNGILCRSYDDITDTYSPEQLRITHNIMAYTDDEWRTVRQAIGKHEYILYDKEKNEFVDEIGYGMNADFVTAGVVSGSQIIGGDIYSDNYSKIKSTGSYLNLRDGTFNFGGGALTFDGDKLYIGSDEADTNITEINEKWLKTTSIYAENLQVKAVNVDGDITAKGVIVKNANGETLLSAGNEKVEIGGWNVDANSLYSTYEDKSSRVFMCTGTLSNYTIGGYTDKWYFGAGTSSGNGFGVTTSGVLCASGAKISGEITATSGNIGGCEIVDNKLTIDAARITSGVFDEARIPELSTDKINVSDVITIGKDDIAKITEDTLSITKVVAQNLHVKAANIDEKLTADQINANNIEAIDVNITGTINSTEGSIGGFDIANGHIQSEDYAEGDGSIVEWNALESEDYSSYLTFTMLTDDTCEVKASNKSSLPSNLVIPSVYDGAMVTSIGNSAFASCTNLVSVSMPDSITTIGQRAFSRCTNLQNIKLSNSITSISRAAFYNCTSLKSIAIPNSVVTIEVNAFAGASLVDGIVIPNSVVVIEDVAFTYTMAKSVVIGSSVMSIGAGAFGENSSLSKVYYHGSQRDWQNILIDMTTTGGYYNDSNNNHFVDNTTKYYYSEESPNNSGNFWHYKDTTGVRVSCDDMLIDSRYFKVFSDGQIIAENAIIKGNVTASSLKATNSFSVGDSDTAEHYITTTQTQDGGFSTTCRKIGAADTYGGYMKANNTGFVIECESGTGQLKGTWSASACLATNSDQSLKYDIETLDDRYSNLFDYLQPVKYKYNDGTSNRFHTGFIAQSVEESIEEAGLSTQDFAAFVRTENNCSLRYEEFIALCVDQIQKLKKRIEELEAKSDV